MFDCEVNVWCSVSWMDDLVCSLVQVMQLCPGGTWRLLVYPESVLTFPLWRLMLLDCEFRWMIWGEEESLCGGVHPPITFPLLKGQIIFELLYWLKLYFCPVFPFNERMDYLLHYPSDYEWHVTSYNISGFQLQPDRPADRKCAAFILSSLHMMTIMSQIRAESVSSAPWPW